jgi:hypothetical protein
VIPVKLPPVAAPIVAPVNVSVVEPAVRPAVLTTSKTVVEVLPAFAGVIAVEDHVLGGPVAVTAAVVMKPGGIVMRTVSVATRSVAVVKPMTILVPVVAPGTRLEGVQLTA